MPRKVLFVDDEPFVTEAFKHILAEEPYEILNVNSVDQALKGLQNSVQPAFLDNGPATRS
jgi:CheY-like chemotaxis protein